MMTTVLMNNNGISEMEAKEYFAEKKVVWFNYNEEKTDDAIDKVFNKTRADDRKGKIKLNRQRLNS